MKWFTQENAKHSLITAGEIADRLPDILLNAQKAAQGLLHGQHGRRTAGSGDHFWQYRSYDPLADSAGRVDWRRSAKSDQLYVREREEERPKTAVLWIDPATSMFYTSDPKKQPSKFEYGFTLCCVLAYVLSEGGERVRSTQDGFAASHSRDVGRLAQMILNSETDPAFEDFKNAQIFVVSDFLERDIEWLQAVKKTCTARKNNLNVIVPLDPAEAAYPFSGHIRFETMQADRKFETQNASNLKSEYLNRLKEHHEKVAAIAGAHNITLLRTDYSLEEAALKLISPFLR